MIVENPYTQPHYLTTYFPIKPKVIDIDRTRNGDIYRKPTQYWFVNCDPKKNIVFEPITYKKQETVYSTNDRVKRSMISGEYANRFIRQFIIDGSGETESGNDGGMAGQFTFDMDGNIM